MSSLTVLPLAFVMIAGPNGEGTVKTVTDWLVLVLFLFLMVRMSTPARARRAAPAAHRLDAPRPGPSPAQEVLPRRCDADQVAAFA